MEKRNLNNILFISIFLIIILVITYFIHIGYLPKAAMCFRELNDDTPVKSGPVITVPWQLDNKFISAREKNGTPVLMAAYRTVLQDPLPGEEYNVHLAASMLAGTVVKPGQIFSQNGTLGPYTEYRGFRKGPTYIGTQLATTIGGGVCKIASTLYNGAISSNMQIIERHAHSMPVPYVPYGQDATVVYGARDMQFKNNTAFPVMIWAEGVDNILYIAFYSKDVPPKIKWHHEIFDIQAAPKIYRKNPQLPAGVQKVLLQGINGATVRSWLTIQNPDGTEFIKNLGISYYSPMAHIIEIND